MTLSGDKELTNVRVANFSDVTLPVKNLLTFSTDDSDAAVAEIRRYADLPYVFLVSDARRPLVAEVLSKLAAMRSPCYPFAVFSADAGDGYHDNADLDKVDINGTDPAAIIDRINAYAGTKFVFDPERLKFENNTPLPQTVDVMIVGAGVTGLYAGQYLKKHKLSYCIAEKREVIGGIWSLYANSTSQVNTSEGAYRIIDDKIRSNRDHSATREILEDLVQLAGDVSDNLFLETHVDRVEKTDGGYLTTVTRNQETVTVRSKGLILAINDRVGTPRKLEWPNQAAFQGQILGGISNETEGFDWKGKRVVIVGMGAFAIENTRTALVGGASHVTVVCRRHGTVCPKIIDYLNFSSPYDDEFKHEKKGNMRNMMFWKKLYDQSGATMPECWMGKVKHEGHTISVSDIWFIGHYLNKVATVTGSITDMYEGGVVVNGGQRVEADVVINCVGFHRNALNVKDICDYREMYNNNYVDKDFMYLADAYLDDDVFNSFFGSSVLEMAKFYMAVYVRFFESPDFDAMLATDGISKIPIEDRRWSHYIDGATALIRTYPEIQEVAKNQVSERTRNFLEAHDLETFIAENKREWMDIHSMLAGRDMKEEECLPYVFERLLK